MQITDTQEFVITVQPEDSKGDPTSDTLTWSIKSTAGSTVTADTTTLLGTVVAGGPETGITVTVTDPNGVTGTLSFDVVAGAAKTLTLTPGSPTDQPPAA
jgi:archaellum component FlaG (FlaF/FlaG flagellin family)